MNSNMQRVFCTESSPSCMNMILHIGSPWEKWRYYLLLVPGSGGQCPQYPDELYGYGTFASPNYPGFYPNNICYQWRISSVLQVRKMSVNRWRAVRLWWHAHVQFAVLVRCTWKLILKLQYNTIQISFLTPLCKNKFFATERKLRLIIAAVGSQSRFGENRKNLSSSKLQVIILKRAKCRLSSA